MAKHFSLTGAFALLILIANAQKNSTEIGFHGGVNFNSAAGRSMISTKPGMLLGFNGGGHIKFNKTEHFGVKIILNYEENGWAYRSLYLENAAGTDIGKGDVIFKLNYLNLPVLAEYTFGNKIKFNAGAGVFVGYLLNNQVITKVKEGLNGSSPSTTRTSPNNRQAINYGISASLGMQLNLSPNVKFELEVRESAGLANIDKPAGSSAGSIKTNSISISPGLTLPF